MARYSISFPLWVSVVLWAFIAGMVIAVVVYALYQKSRGSRLFFTWKYLGAASVLEFFPAGLYSVLAMLSMKVDRIETALLVGFLYAVLSFVLHGVSLFGAQQWLRHERDSVNTSQRRPL